MAKRKPRKMMSSIVDITLNPDGTKTVRRYGPLRPAYLTPEELRPWLDLAYHNMMRREAEAAAEAAKAPPKKAKAKRKAAKRKRRGR